MKVLFFPLPLRGRVGVGEAVHEISLPLPPPGGRGETQSSNPALPHALLAVREADTESNP